MAKKDGDKKDEKIRRESYKDMHVKLDYKLIDYMKNLKNWPAMEPPPIQKKSREILTDEKIEEMAKRTFDFDYVLRNHLMDEEIVWDEDVWGLRNITENLSDDRHAKEEDKNRN